MKSIALALVALAAPVAAAPAENPQNNLASSGSLAKVTELLESLKTSVIEDGRAAAESYDKFACWCKETTEQVSGEIAHSITEINDAQAQIDEANANIEAETLLLNGHIKALAEMQKRWATETKTMEAYKKLHMEVIEDLSSALRAIDEVKGLLENANSSFLQTHQSMMSFPAIAKSPVLVALLQERRGPTSNSAAPGEQGEYQDTLSGSEIMTLLEEFKTKLTTEKDNRIKEYELREAAYQEEWARAQEDKDPNKITAIEADIDASKQEIAGFETTIGEQQTRMAGDQMTLSDDQNYLKKATTQCETKARIWDQQSTLRAEEVKMLAQAIQILRGIEGNAFFLQMEAHPVKRALAKAQAKKEIRKAHAAAKLSKEAPKKHSKAHAKRTIDPVETTSMHVSHDGQTHKQRHSVAHSTQEATFEGGYRLWHDKTGAVIARSWIGDTPYGKEMMAREQAKHALLQVKGMESMQNQVMRDPLKKVKQLINEMIQRLLEEAKDENTQHGWCQKELGKVAGTIKHEEPRAKKYSAKMVELQSQMDTLNDELLELNGDGTDDNKGTIAEAQEALSEAETNRSGEKALNDEAMLDAKNAIEAVSQALSILTSFYNKAGAQKDLSKVELKKEVDGREGREFSQEGPSEKYGGAQDTATNILQLLEVVKGKYETEHAEIKHAEQEAEQEFRNLRADLSAKIAGMSKSRDLKQDALNQASADKTNTDEKLKSTLTLLNAAFESQQKLRPACINTGPTKAERQAQIQAQIDALNEALEALA